MAKRKRQGIALDVTLEQQPATSSGSEEEVEPDVAPVSGQEPEPMTNPLFEPVTPEPIPAVVEAIAAVSLSTTQHEECCEEELTLPMAPLEQIVVHEPIVAATEPEPEIVPVTEEPEPVAEPVQTLEPVVTERRLAAKFFAEESFKGFCVDVFDDAPMFVNNFVFKSIMVSKGFSVKLSNTNNDSQRVIATDGDIALKTLAVAKPRSAIIYKL